MKRAWLALALACKAKTAPPEDRVPVVERDAPRAVWNELAGQRVVAPVRTIALPVRDVPRFEVGGPAIAGDLAIVASSQFGFHAVAWRTGAVAWTKPAGAHVAPPLVRGDGSVVLIAACLHPPDVPATERLLGCVRVVGADGVDASHVAIRGAAAATEPFALARGVQRVRTDGARVHWQRDDEAIALDPATGAAVPARAIERDDEAGAAAPTRAVQLDLRRHYIATPAWVWPLPEHERADPIGLAVTPDRHVVVFHDGDTLTVLPDPGALDLSTP